MDGKTDDEHAMGTQTLLSRCHPRRIGREFEDVASFVGVGESSRRSMGDEGIIPVGGKHGERLISWEFHLARKSGGGRGCRNNACNKPFVSR